MLTSGYKSLQFDLSGNFRLVGEKLELAKPDDVLELKYDFLRVFTKLRA